MFGMSASSMGLILRPLISQYLEPLEENGTIAKLQSDIELAAERGAIVSLANLIHNMERHNALLERLVTIFEAGSEEPRGDGFRRALALAHASSDDAGNDDAQSPGLFEQTGTD